MQTVIKLNLQEYTRTVYVWKFWVKFTWESKQYNVDLVGYKRRVDIKSSFFSSHKMSTCIRISTSSSLCARVRDYVCVNECSCTLRKFERWLLVFCVNASYCSFSFLFTKSLLALPLSTHTRMLKKAIFLRFRNKVESKLTPPPVHK